MPVGNQSKCYFFSQDISVQGLVHGLDDPGSIRDLCICWMDVNFRFFMLQPLQHRGRVPWCTLSWNLHGRFGEEKTRFPTWTRIPGP
jgi:hypothetical protein